MPLKEEFLKQGNFLFKHRSNLPLIIVLAGISVYVYTLLTNNISYYEFITNKKELIYLIVALFGLLIRAYSVGFSADNTSGRNTKVGQVADSINKTGIYSIVRHPLYIGNFFMWLSIALFTNNFWFIIAFVFLYWLYYERIMYAEEEFLRDKYGETYINWATETPAIIPNFKKWTKPEGKFNLWKVLKQEKSGVLNLMLTIFLFKIIAGYTLYEQFTFANTYWSYTLIVAIIYYAIVKIIQKYMSR